jgi:hypothetical protein
MKTIRCDWCGAEAREPDYYVVEWALCGEMGGGREDVCSSCFLSRRTGNEAPACARCAALLSDGRCGDGMIVPFPDLTVDSCHVFRARASPVRSEPRKAEPSERLPGMEPVTRTALVMHARQMEEFVSAMPWPQYLWRRLLSALRSLGVRR